MKFALTTTTLATALLLGACASTPPAPPPELVQARESVRAAESDSRVLASAPLELKKATDSLSQANMMLNKGESLGEVASTAYIADRQAQTAMAVARSKANEDGIRAADADRERARADVNADAARRAQNQAASAQGAAAAAQARASAAGVRAANAEAQVANAQASAADAQQQAALLSQQLAAMQAKATDRGMLVTLGDVLFEFGRAEVKPGSQADLAKVADFLKSHPERRVLIEGYTDSVGGTEINKTLSKRRADAVASALSGMGVQSDRIASAGYGKEYPVADNSTDTNRALNRRVEVYISNNDQPVQPRRS